jgi:F0F1-type ATP synthase membrane subunit c/vacuolar-type H+-ATPase subunit K
MRRSRDLARSLTTLKARYLVVNFIGLAMIAAVFVYAGVVEVIKWKLAPFAGFAGLEPHTAAQIKYIFLALAAAHFGVIKAVGKILPSRSVENLSTTAVITLALCEAVALLGLVLFLLAGQAMDFYIFMVISLGFFTLFFPKYDQWEERLRAADSPPKTDS